MYKSSPLCSIMSPIKVPWQQGSSQYNSCQQTQWWLSNTGLWHIIDEFCWPIETMMTQCDTDRDIDCTAACGFKEVLCSFILILYYSYPIIRKTSVSELTMVFTWILHRFQCYMYFSHFFVVCVPQNLSKPML